MKKEDIERLSGLARIKLTDKEAQSFADDITSIIGYVSEIQEIVGGANITKSVGAVSNVMREDTNPHEPGLYTEDLLNAAPEREGQYVKVKKILEEK